jgi:AraC-like DNA-binding protein
VRALFDSLLRLAALAAEDVPPPAAHEPALRPALLRALMAFVDARLDDPGLSVAMTAAHLGVSKRYVHRLCEGTGRSFTEHVVDRRLDRALAALTAPPPSEGRGPTIAEIAYRSGFSDLSHFNRRFKARFGATPRELRG